MREPNDIKLAENVPEIDLILGGHDHHYDIKEVCIVYDLVLSETSFTVCRVSSPLELNWKLKRTGSIKTCW